MANRDLFLQGACRFFVEVVKPLVGIWVQKNPVIGISYPLLDAG